MGIGQRTARVRQRAGQRFLVQGAEDQNRSKPGINLPNLSGARDAAGEQSLLLRRRSSAIDCWYCLGWLGGFSEEGFSQFVGLIPAAILFSGAGGSVLAVHQINKNRELGAELQLLKSQNPRDEKLGTILERIEFFEALRDWGIVTEEEFLEKGRALLDLEEPRRPSVAATEGGSPPW